MAQEHGSFESATESGFLPGRTHRLHRFGGILFAVIAAFMVTTQASAQDPCEVDDNGSGTVTLPPAGCEYLSPLGVHEIIDGLPVGTTIELAIEHKFFFCNNMGGSPTGYYSSCSIAIDPGECEGDDPFVAGGKIDCFESEAEITMTGTGSLAGFSRTLTVPLFTEIATAPRTPGDPVQTFATEMRLLTGDLPPGDPDFCSLQLQAGSDPGLKSDGQTTLTLLPSGRFKVDSFFDVSYSIFYAGCPGSALDGLSGFSPGSVHMEAFGAPPPVPALAPTGIAVVITLLLGTAVFYRIRGASLHE